MSNYRRVKIEGAWYFFTLVTYKRRSFLTDDVARPILKLAAAVLGAPDSR